MALSRVWMCVQVPLDGLGDVEREELQDLRDKYAILEAKVQIAEDEIRTVTKEKKTQKELYETQLRKMREQNPAALVAKHSQEQSKMSSQFAGKIEMLEQDIRSPRPMSEVGLGLGWV